jgi:hypothetical protein
MVLEKESSVRKYQSISDFDFEGARVLDGQQRFLVYGGGLILGLIVIGGALFYAILVYQERTVPPGLLFVLGASLNGIASLLLGKGYLKSTNGLTETAQANHGYLQEITERLNTMDDQGTHRSTIQITDLSDRLEKLDETAVQERAEIAARLAAIEAKLATPGGITQ